MFGFTTWRKTPSLFKNPPLAGSEGEIVDPKGENQSTAEGHTEETLSD